MSNIAGVYDWLVWGIALMIGLPVLVVLLGELGGVLERRGDLHTKKPVDAARKSCLFLLFGVLLLRQVVGLPGGHIAVKVIDTAFWISVLNVVLLVFNAVIFRPGASDWRARAPRLLVDLGRLFMVAVGGALVVSRIWSIDLSGLLAALGVGSVVIGLAMQDTLGNVFSGIAVISSRQFAIGDWIRVGDVEGQVRSINWRTVTVATAGDFVVIPNSQIARDRLRVFSADTGMTSVVVDLKLSYEHPPEQIHDLLAAAATMTKNTGAAPIVRTLSYDDFAIQYRVTLAVKDFRDVGPVRNDFLANVWYVTERAGIVFPARYNQNFELPKEFVRQRHWSSDAIAARLKTLGALQSSNDVLSRLARHARVELYRKGESLIHVGSRSKAAYVVGSGTALAFDVHEGAETLIDEFSPGDLILFKAVLRGAAAPCAVRARSDVEVIVIPIKDLETALSDDMAFADEIERLLATRDEARSRTVSNGLAERLNGSGANKDRVEILRNMFQT
jgi:small-conductance mechanosensitive channel/CRP-like cAMP-binding protein